MVDLDDSSDDDAADDDQGHQAEVGPVGCEVFELTIDAANNGDRLDAAVVQAAQVSRAQAQRLFEAGAVSVNGVIPPKMASRVRAGDRVRVEIPVATPLQVLAENIALDIYFEDAHLIVINKPAGMVVHPAPGHASGTLVNALLHHCRDLSGIGGVLRPGIVHRLDKDTSGLMVVSKHDAAHQGLADMFAAKSRGDGGGISRRYLALCAPGPRRDLGRQGTIRTLYGRHGVHRKLFSSKVSRGKPAVSHWQLIEALPAAALLEFTLQTGRTHQIRVHAADHGFPVFGDVTYGHRQRDAQLAALATQLGRQALHAHVLQFIHPVTAVPLEFSAPVPVDMANVLAAMRGMPKR
ncbi:MAG: RluA family pseudouridine synthase [Kofleriaceae bacterium]|nr:RluA family pseudouridine synthase [Kofleriaceae bacterium]